MKKLFILSLCTFIFGRSISQYKEIDEKMQFLGIPFLSAPDYSQLSFKAEAKKNMNVYTFKKQKAFTTPDYLLSTIYVGIGKGRILDFTCEVPNDTDYNKINKQLAEVFTDKGDVTIVDMFGDADSGSIVVAKEKNWYKLRVYCVFGNGVKQSDYHLLNHVAFK